MKVGNPNLAHLLKQVELNELKNKMPEFYNTYKLYCQEEAEETIAYYVVKLADTVSVIQYSNLEIELGNQTNEDAYERASKLTNLLEQKMKEDTEIYFVQSISLSTNAISK
jgi:hypothetical protein